MPKKKMKKKKFYRIDSCDSKNEVRKTEFHVYETEDLRSNNPNILHNLPGRLILLEIPVFPDFLLR